MPISLIPQTRVHLPWTKRLESLHVAERAAGVERLNRVAMMNERLVKKTQDRTLGTKTEEPQDKHLEEDMSVTVGDTIHNHHYPPPQSPSPEPTSHPPPNRRRSNLSPFVQGLIATSLVLLGILLGLLIWNQLQGTNNSTTEPTAIFDISGPEVEP